MKTFFAFIDDAGNYQQERNDEFTARNPYFIKACIIIPGDKWKILASYRNELIQKNTGQALHEIKWNHIWKLRRRDVLHKTLSYRRKETFLKSISFDSAHNYVKELLAQLPEIEAKVVFTVTPNCVFHSQVSEKNIERMHLQDLMQRVEMETAAQDQETGLAILFCDQMSGENDEIDLKAKYHELYCSGDFIATYRHIMDSVCFISSHHSCGIQLADFVAGAFNGFLRGYDLSEKIFALQIYAYIRKRVDGHRLGYGIVEVPKHPASRKHLEEKFKTDFSKYDITDDQDIPF